jgi:hypothetical protein
MSFPLSAPKKNMLSKNTEILQESALFLKPWDARILCLASHSCNVVISSILPKIDNAVFYCRKGNPTNPVCHPHNLIFFGSVALQETMHDCHSFTALCNGRTPGMTCYQNNDGIDNFHWDVQNVNIPIKCVYCGIVYLSSTTCKEEFHLSTSELECIDVYGVGLRKAYKLREVRWLALVRNHSIAPLYRYSITRERREKWLMDAKSSLTTLSLMYNKFFDVDTLLASNCAIKNFRNQSGGTLQDLNNIMERLKTILPRMFEVYEQMSSYDPTMRVYPKMYVFVKKYFTNSWYSEMYDMSVESCIDIALHEEDEGEAERHAIMKLRKMAFNVFKLHNSHLKTCYELRNPNYQLYNSFLDGNISPRTLINEAYCNVVKDTRKKELISYLHSRGIFPESKKCHLFNEYCDNISGTKINAVTEEEVFKCMVYKHIIQEAGECNKRLKL